MLLRVEPHGLLRLAVPQFLPSSALFALHPSVSVLSHKLNIRFCVTFAHHIRISSSTTSLRNSWDQPGETEHEVKRSAWVLYEQEPFSSDIEDYRARRQLALVESLAAMQAGKSMYSRRVVSIWAYQRGLARTGKEFGKSLQGKEQR